MPITSPRYGRVEDETVSSSGTASGSFGVSPKAASRTSSANGFISRFKASREYGFPESHAASFALLVYASAWLKLHHPAEFAAALINSQPMGFYSVSTILQDAKRHGVKLLPIDVNESTWDCQCVIDEGETKIRLGLRLVAELREATAKRTETARPFTSVDDVLARVMPDQKESVALAEAGALDELVGHSRRVAIWQVVAPRQDGLFAKTRKSEKTPKLPAIRARSSSCSTTSARACR